MNGNGQIVITQKCARKDLMLECNANASFYFSTFRGWQQEAKKHDTEKHRNRDGSRNEESYGSAAKSGVH